MKAEITRVTPTLAVEWLSKNGGNRKIKKAHVARLAMAIERGEWELNGDSIKLSKNGKLIDGQHRLSAIIQSQKAIDTLVVHGLGDVFSTIDTGATRTASDVLGIKGEKRTSVLAGVCRAIYMAENGLYHSKDKPTHKQVLITLENNPDVRHSVTIVGGFTHLKGMSNVTMSFLHFVGCEAGRELLATEFVRKCFTGEDCKKGDPALTYRNKVIKGAMSGGVHKYEGQVWAWRSFLAHMRGERLTKIIAKPTDRLPDLAGMIRAIKG